ncbi:hypothetical protein BFP77_14590 [Maribacter sp. 4U21]|jgi:hypothetical protein|uniref:hypothetical protein n=1 Tax=Maribacter sp. 4U21 TaxID=1889779 RepID=UPI000C15A681|nr:hypothetical protein [Maribacter sp. 4U21]PIB26219.1 hypothetical protein BFP77_14590 [Maribacter sp. 4U21]
MKSLKRNLFLAGTLLAFFNGVSQDSLQQKSNIQQYTPSKLIGKGQVDIKWFNNLYTQTESTFTDGEEPRQSFFTSTFEFYTGVGRNNRVNLGFIARLRSNVISSQNDERGALDVFSFSGDDNSRSGLTAFAPSIKFVPFASVSNFSIQSSLFIPLIDNETENGVFLEQNGFVWQNRLFYDYTFPGNKWQLFTELTTELNFGDQDESFANNSLNINPGVFISYFPSSKFTVLALVQHSQRLDLGNDFAQDFTAVGGGAKYQLTKALNVEVLYTNFVRGSNTGLGETFNIGLRGIF